MADTSKMRLHWSPRSPFVRKVMIAAHELGLADRLETIRTRVATNQVHKGLLTDNPIGKIPTLLLADGTILYDSVVICEYLDSIAPQPKLFPPSGAARFQALRRHALGNGYLDMLLMWRNESSRAAPNPGMIESWQTYDAEYLGGGFALDNYLLMTSFPVNSIDDLAGRRIGADRDEV